MNAKGMTTRDISSHVKEIYGFRISESTVTKITNKILPSIEEWQNRPLDPIYPIVFLDAMHYNVRENGSIVKKAVYIALGYNVEGFKEILADAILVAGKIIAKREEEIEELRPKADYYDKLVYYNLLTNFRNTAKELGIPQNQFIIF